MTSLKDAILIVGVFFLGSFVLFMCFVIAASIDVAAWCQSKGLTRYPNFGKESGPTNSTDR